LLNVRRQPLTYIFPYTTLFRSAHQEVGGQPQHEVLDREAATALLDREGAEVLDHAQLLGKIEYESQAGERGGVVSGGFELDAAEDRKSTRLNSSHVAISYAVFC